MVPTAPWPAWVLLLLWGLQSPRLSNALRLRVPDHHSDPWHQGPNPEPELNDSPYSHEADWVLGPFFFLRAVSNWRCYFSVTCANPAAPIRLLVDMYSPEVEDGSGHSNLKPRTFLS